VTDLIAQLTALLDPKLGDRYELIFVDDDSPDATCSASGKKEPARSPGGSTSITSATWRACASRA
jgi:glycosyltransferase involved in cell wall biosynthesis